MTGHDPGFKFDGGDPEYYRYHGEATGAGKLNAHEHCEAFGRVGLQYNLSEFRAGWKVRGASWCLRHGARERWSLFNHMAFCFICPRYIAGQVLLSGVGVDGEAQLRTYVFCWDCLCIARRVACVISQ